MLHSTKTLTILENFIELKFNEPVRVLDLLNAKKIGINQSCGGFGICTTCRFFVREGQNSFSERSDLEMERAEERNFLDNERLACQTEILENAVIEIPT